METLTRTQNSVAFHLLKAVFVIYFLFTFVLTISHMLLEYRNTKSAVNRELVLVHQSFSEGLSTALFELNEEQLHAIVNGMVTLPAVTGVQIDTVGSSVVMSDALGTVINPDNKQVTITDAGVRNNSDVLFWHDFTIYFQDSDRVLGTGRIYSSNAVVYEQVREIFVIILGGAILKTLMLWFLFLWAARSRLNRPITVLAAVMDAMKFDADERLAIDIQPSSKKGCTDIRFDLAGRLREQVEVHTHDEIHRLTSSFKSLSESAQRKLQGLNLLSETAANLIKLTETDAVLSEMPRALAHRYPITAMLAVLDESTSESTTAWWWQMPAATVRATPLAATPSAQSWLHSLSQPTVASAADMRPFLPASIPASMPHADTQQWLVLPLVDAEHRLGSLAFTTADAAVELGPEDEAFLGALSRLLVIALKNTQMLNVIREQSRTLELQVNIRTEQLQRAVKELESFNYAVSHDLRAPLRHVNSFLQLLTEDLTEQSKEKIQPLINRMQLALQRMRDMIEGMLTLASAGHAAPKTTAVPLTGLVTDVIGELAEEARQRTHFELGELGTVQADRTLLRQVLQNLIDNAVKYAGKNPAPVVWIQQVPDASDDEQVTVLVRDNGVGFDPQYGKKLFNLFQRLHRAEEFPGTGVGLALCAKIIQLHGGRIWAEGQLGQGACFYFTMPAGQAGPEH